jgi:hypothetical protein
VSRSTASATGTGHLGMRGICWSRYWKTTKPTDHHYRLNHRLNQMRLRRPRTSSLPNRHSGVQRDMESLCGPRFQNSKSCRVADLRDGVRETTGNGDQQRLGWSPLWSPLCNTKMACRVWQTIRSVMIHWVNRAGDGTRTHDVQLGKRGNANAVIAEVAKNQRRTASLLR